MLRRRNNPEVDEMLTTELNRFKRRLLKEERYLLTEIQGQASELTEATESAGEERASAPEDAGADIFEHEKTLAVEGAFEEMLAEVRHALHKIAAGSYGICDDCGQKIELERLEARPQASLCLACRTREEHAHNGRARTLARSAR